MAENSKIEWTDSTFNPWVGCRKVSPACDHCYAEGWAKRSGMVEWGGPRRRTSENNWNNPRRWNRKAAAFQEQNKRRQRVFCASLADVFDSEVPNEWRTDLWHLVRDTPMLDWLFLTKRPKLIAAYLPADLQGKPNVWLGTTVENEKMFRARVPFLKRVPAAVRFLSVEPLLEDIPVRAPWLDGIDWVLVGGESGLGYRNIKPEWARHWRDTALEAGVAFHFKQWSGLRPKDLGRMLDGRIWDESPIPRHV